MFMVKVVGTRGKALVQGWGREKVKVEVASKQSLKVSRVPAGLFM